MVSNNSIDGMLLENYYDVVENDECTENEEDEFFDSNEDQFS